MKVLIVDDQYDEKVQCIAKKLKALGVNDIKHVSNSLEAYREMVDKTYDLLIIDLQIPESFGEDINERGGLDLLDLITNEKGFNIPSNIVGITSHYDSYVSNNKIFSDSGWTLHLFNGETDFLNTVIDMNMKIIKDNNYDVAIITALRHTEFDALLRNGMHWEVLDIDDCNKYYTSSFIDKDGINRKVIATYCPSMGMPISSAVTMKMILKFSPKIVVMTGIAAGVEGKAELGDILVPNQLWDWGNGKISDGEDGSFLQNDPEILRIDSHLATELNDIANDGLYVDDIKRSFQGNAPRHSLSMRVGPMASGSAVLADTKTIEQIKTQKRSVIGIEMEAYGVLTAANLAGIYPTKALIVKSVCDFANADKNDDWQKYAAYTSTRFAFKILENHINFKRL
ncbi:hypothetical protein [Photobacterium damselae]|uniref:phosphorylase family protein n=1 Tax=Photobacterium damselae TaxID=38293 RepID=UPI001EE0F990|nr:hypothetical protein [Photobacterium damselae]MCG3824315.1 hypothetical protein [Photobacterium damselae]